MGARRTAACLRVAALAVVVLAFFYATREKRFRAFSEVARKMSPLTDKVAVHGYEVIYDAYFTRETAKKKIKFLEIGLGCRMGYGPGVSSKIWPKLFPNGEIWFAEIDEKCIHEFVQSNHVDWKFVTGDQADNATLADWISITGGDFDFIIDDGGHQNTQVWNSFHVLFPQALKSGGVYFIEDLGVNRIDPWYNGGIADTNGSVVIEAISEWVDQLAAQAYGKKVQARQFRFILPPGIARIDCIKELCAISKK